MRPETVGRVSDSFGVATLTVEPGQWVGVHEQFAADGYGLDWLTAVDNGDATAGDGSSGRFRLVSHLVPPVTRTLSSNAHVIAVGFDNKVRVSQESGYPEWLIQTTISSDEFDSLVPVFAGAAWHERELAEMFGLRRSDGEQLAHLLLPVEFDGHPLRKDFVLAARVAKRWPGAKDDDAKENGAKEPEAASRGRGSARGSRRRTLPPGVPADWPKPVAAALSQTPGQTQAQTSAQMLGQGLNPPGESGQPGVPPKGPRRRRTAAQATARVMKQEATDE